MINKFILGIMIIFLALPLAYSQQQTLGEFNRGDIINLLQTCECSEVNFTSVVSVEDGLNINLISETVAEQNVNVFNLTFETNENFSLGQYFVTGFGVIETEEISFIYDFILLPEDNDFFNIDFNSTPTIVFFVVSLFIVGGLTFFKFFIGAGSLMAILGFTIGYSLHWGFGLLFVAIGILLVTRSEGK